MRTSRIASIILACVITIPSTPLQAQTRSGGTPQVAVFPLIPVVVGALISAASAIFAGCHKVDDDVLAPSQGIDTVFKQTPLRKTYAMETSFDYDTNPKGLAKSFECFLDDQKESAFKECPPPFRLTNLPVGTHTFYVRAIAADGTKGPVNYYEWTVYGEDAPIARIIPPYPSGLSREAKFTFTVDSQYRLPVVFECSLDAGPYETCISPWSCFNLRDGSHTFAVRALRAAGHAGIGPVDTFTWTVSVDSLSSMKGAYVLLNVGTAASNQSRLYYLQRGSNDTSYALLSNAVPGLGNGASDIEIDEPTEHAFVAVNGPTKRIVAIDLSRFRANSTSAPSIPFADLHISRTPYGKEMIAADGLSNSIYRMNLPSLTVTDTLRMGSSSSRPSGITAAGNKIFACMFNNGLGDALQIVNWQNRSRTSKKLKPGVKFAETSEDGRTVWTVCTGNSYTTPPTTGWIYAINPATNGTIDSAAHNKQIFASALGGDGSMYIIESTSGANQGTVHRFGLNAGKISVSTNVLSEPYQSVAADDRNIFAARADATGNVVLDIYPISGGSYLKRFSFSVAPGPVNFLMVKVR